MKPIQDQLNDQKNFLNFCQQIANLKLEDLTRTKLGEINFEQAEILFKQIISFFSAAAKCQWDNVPLSTILNSSPPSGGQILQSDLTQLGNTINQIKTFSVLPTDPAQRRNNLVNQLENFWMRAYSVLAPVVTYQIATDANLTTTVAKEIESIRATMKNVNTDFENVNLRRNLKTQKLKLRQSRRQSTGCYKVSKPPLKK